jgi:hypothetical protein
MAAVVVLALLIQSASLGGYGPSEAQLAHEAEVRERQLWAEQDAFEFGLTDWRKFVDGKPTPEAIRRWEAKHGHWEG